MSLSTAARGAARASLALAAILLGGAAGPAIVVEARLAGPSDSHEPQRALLDLRNTGSERTGGPVAYACRFLGGDGALLERVAGSVPGIDGGATLRAEALYYGWPRARAVACGLAEPAAD